jgi:hypothetical protein
LIPALLRAYGSLREIQDDFWRRQKQAEIRELVRACAGLWLEAISGDYSAVAGDSVALQIMSLNRSHYPFRLQQIDLPFEQSTLHMDTLQVYNVPIEHAVRVAIPSQTAISQPYWLAQDHDQTRYQIDNPILVGRPLGETLKVGFWFSTEGDSMRFEVPIYYRWTDRVRGELHRPFEVRPSVSLNFGQKVYLFAGSNNAGTVNITVKANRAPIAGRLRLSAPSDWQISPTEQPFAIENKYGEQMVAFQVQPCAKDTSVLVLAKAEIGDQICDRSHSEIDHPHIPLQGLFPVAAARLVRLNLAIPGSQIGYIMGPGDEIPDCLAQLGYHVTLLDDAGLEGSSLARFDAIVTGIRAYNTRERLRHLQPGLLAYVHDGGTLIVQYNVAFGLVTDMLGPYPFRISRDRVTLEDAPVVLVKPGHSLLNHPNKITLRDFDGWVQERGLYFADEWDERYETVIACRDPGETDKKGGLLFARYGKGVFIYTGYAWFRQLPAGITGAYRLFVNMLSSRNYPAAN